MKRRALLGGMVGMASAPSVFTPGRLTAETLPSALDPNNPDHIGFLQKKLIYATDDRPIIWWIRGNKYGSINGEITPLWTLNVVLFKGVSHNEDGTLDVRSMEIVYKTDIETDELLNEWRNPYNGEVYEEVPLIMGPLTRRFDNSGPISQTDLPGAKIVRSGRLGPAEVAQDDVWLLSDVSVTVDREGQESFRAHDLSTYHGKISDVLNPDIASAPATITVHIIQSWHPWMNMGDQEGTLVTRINGAKCDTIGEMHPRIAGFVKAIHPDIARDFVERLQGPPERFER